MHMPRFGIFNDMSDSFRNLFITCTIKEPLPLNQKIVPAVKTQITLLINKLSANFKAVMKTFNSNGHYCTMLY